MYTVKEILIRIPNQWLVGDRYATISSLLSRSPYILITLFNPGSSVTTQYQLNLFPGIYTLDPTVTVADYFSTYSGNLPSNQMNIQTLGKVNYVSYNDLWDYGLIANRVSSSNVALNDHYYNLPDITITPGKHFSSSLSSLTNNVLFLVNGIMPNTVYNPTSVLLKNASQLLDIYQDSNLAVLDFSAVGGFQNIPMTEQNLEVHTQSNTNAVIYFTVPTITGTPALVVNGRLHVFNDIYTVINSTTIAITLNYKSLIKEAYTLTAQYMPQYVDYGYVNTNYVTTDNSLLSWIQSADNLGGGYNIQSIDPVAYLTQGNSALLMLNTTELSYLTLQLEQTTIESRYPLPLYTKTGLIPDDNQYVIQNYTADGYTQSNNGLFNTNQLTNGILIEKDGSIMDYKVISNDGFLGISIMTSKPKMMRTLIDTIPIDVTTRGVNCAALDHPSQSSPAILKYLYTI